ncbi:MAG: POTRA domain-containing protein, partial [Bacillota bacterium]
MNKNFKIIILVCLLVLATNNLALANDISGNKITDIEVQGNAQIDANKVLEQVNIEVGDKIVNEKLKKDLESIYELGYFSNVKINFQNYQDGVRLIFQVVENPTLSKIELEGNNVVSNSKLKELLQVKTGEM